MPNFKFEVDVDGIALITWDMPGRSMNVIDMAVIEELAQLVDKVANDAAIKGAVVTSGKDSFCGGADLTMLERMGATYADLVKREGAEAANKMRVRRKPQALAASTGSWKNAASRGLPPSTAPPWAAASSSALACHHRVASDNPKTRLGLPEIKVGLFPGAGGTQRVARMLPPADALQFLLKGDQLKARPRQGDEADRRGGARRRSGQEREGLDQGRRQGGKRPGT